MSKIKVKGFKVKQDNNRFSQDTYVLGPVNIEDGNATGSVKTIGVNLNYTLGEYAFAEGFLTQALGANSHTEGRGTTTLVGGIAAHAEGNATVASGANSHAEGDSTTASRTGSHAEGKDTAASGLYSHAEGRDTTASGNNSHAEGLGTIANGENCHAEGYNTTASNLFSHAEGRDTTASGNISHAEGYYTTALGIVSHAEGDHTTTTASGYASHAEGYNTLASGRYSHAEGHETIVSGENSHTQNLGTIAASDNQTTLGKYNIEDSNDEYAVIIGNGSSNNNRSNALAIDWNGNIITNGQLTNLQGDFIYNNNLKNLVDGSTEGSLRSIGSVEEQDKILIISDPVSGRNHDFIPINIDISTIPDNLEIRNNLIISVDIYETTDANIFTEVNNNGEPYVWEITDDQLTFIYNGVHVEEESEDKDIYIKVKVEVPDNYVYHLGLNAFAEGLNTKASGEVSHAQNLGTIAASDNQTALGKYNIEDSNNEYAVIIGNGTANNTRSNALTVDWDGNLYLSGDIRDMLGNSLLEILGGSY